MNDLLNRIKALIPSLPKSDINIANKFLANRDFDSLQLLITSAIIRVKKGLRKEIPKEEYLNADLDKMIKLQSSIDCYCEALNLPIDESNDTDDNYNLNFY